jgi:hypothetical protein
MNLVIIRGSQKNGSKKHYFSCQKQKVLTKDKNILSFQIHTMKRQLIYCSNTTAQSGEPITTYNHHNFKFENTFQVNPYEMLLVIAKPNTNSVIYQHALYKNYQLRPSDGYYHVCLNVFHNSDKSILILKNYTLKSLT